MEHQRIRLKISFDGDRTSCNAVYTEDSIREIESILGKKETYLNIKGGFKTTTGIHTVELALHNLTGRTPEED